MSRGLFNIGFGYLTLGTVTLKPRDGNPKPRLWRLPNDSLINSMGFPNPGASCAASRLSKQSKRLHPTMLSISGVSVEDIVECYRILEPHVDGLEVNISTPNTAGVRVFQDPLVLVKLLDAIAKVRNREKPLWLKLPPYFTENARDNVLALVDVCTKNDIDALTVANAKPVQEERASTGTGGLSGSAIYENMLKMLADVYGYAKGKIPLNACGGISSGLGAWRAFESGASSVQLLTALVYEGPGVVAKINKGILKLLANSGSRSLNDVIGTGLR